MADLYVDHGAYATNIGTTPTWGVPQEGDGSSKDAATASSIGSILMTAVPTSGTISVFGVTVSTTGVIGAASADAAANTLATNINATTTAVASGVAIGVPQLRNLVFARGPSGGAPAGTCQIMTRVGSTTLNVTGIATTFTGTPTLTQFAGGSGGCWGWLVNSAAIGVSSSIAAMSYGLLTRTPMVWTATPTTDDTVWVRSGTNPTITYSSTTFNLQRAETWPISLVIDTNTKWTGDGTAGVVTLNLTASSTTSNCLWSPSFNNFTDSAGIAISLAAIKKHGLVINYATTGGVGPLELAAASSTHHAHFRVCGVLFADVSTGTNALYATGGTIGTGGGAFAVGAGVYVDCTFRRVNSVANLLPIRLAHPSVSNTTKSFYFQGCAIEANVSGAVAPSIINLSGATGGGSPSPVIFSFQNCSITGWVSGGNKFQLTDAAPASLTGLRIVARDFQGASFSSAYAGLARTVGQYNADECSLLLHNPQSGGPFRYENIAGVADFDPDSAPAYPTLAATQGNGTSWSLRAVWLSTAGVVRRTLGFRMPPLRVTYLDSSATRTIKLELFMRTALSSAIQPDDMALTVTYVSDTTGNQVNVSVRGLPGTSAASWTGAGSWSGYAARSYSFTTSDPIKPGTEISFQLAFYGAPRTGSTESVFIDPEPSIT